MDITTKDFKSEHAHIKGWGIDADQDNEPTYPMKKYTGDDHRRLNYERPSLQSVDIEVLQSNERPTMTAVFGTSTPPSGLSGMIRRFGFRFSEGSWFHWLPLILADRVNMVEGIVDDFKQGHIPNIIAERGWTAEWKYNRNGLIKKAVVAAAITTAVVALIALKNRRNDDD
jgi:hypothetical protein